MDLYTDQVITLLSEYLKPFHAKDQEEMVTSTTINNYVKHEIVSLPVKKKYTKNHVAYLMVVYILRMVYRMGEISKLIRVQIYKYPIDQAYNYFCAKLECCLKRIFAYKKVHHASSGDEGNLVVDLIRNTAQAVAYMTYVRHELEYSQIMIQEESGIQVAFTIVYGSLSFFVYFLSPVAYSITRGVPNE